MSLLNTTVRKSFYECLNKNDESKTEGVGNNGHKVVVDTKQHTKFIATGTLEKGDSFGFGEDLRNVYLIAAVGSECLVIPSHVMMTAERHIEEIERESVLEPRESHIEEESRSLLGPSKISCHDLV